MTFAVAARRLTVALGAALMLLAAGCERVDVTGTTGEPVPMLFSTYSPRPTKADDSYAGPGETVLPVNSSFGVFAYYQEGDVEHGTVAHWEGDSWHTDGDWTPDFMFDQEVQYKGGTTYDYTPLRYWPTNIENTISFWAYYPYSAYQSDNSRALKLYKNNDLTGDYDASSTGLPASLSYTVQTDATAQQDLMFDTFENKDKTYLNCPPTPGVVPLTFRHALSLVRFNFGELPDGVSITVTDMTLDNLYMSGSLTDLTPATPGAYAWTTTGARGSATCSATDLSSYTAAFILMPQSLEDATPANEPELSITFNMTIAAADGGDPIQYSGNTGTAKLKYFAPDPANNILAFAPGKSYLYTISLSLDTIEFSEAVESPAWNTTVNVNL